MPFRFAIFLLSPSVLAAVEPAIFTAEIRPFIEHHCVKCHGPEKQKGKLRLDTLPPDFTDPRTAERWKEVVDSVSSHEMPPEEEPRPHSLDVAKFASWLETRLADAETAKRPPEVVLRRMNRSEYNNTIRDLLGVDFQPASRFPDDPQAGGYDNVGTALTISPLRMELYYDEARTILDRALFAGPRPEVVKWRFDPEENADRGMDVLRVKRGRDNVILNAGQISRIAGEFTFMRREAWNGSIGFRDFAVAVEGDYLIRLRAAAKVPERKAFTAWVRQVLEKRRAAEIALEPQKKQWIDDDFENRVKHFETSRTYDYGPPRLKLTQDLAGTPSVIAELDIAAPVSAPQVYELTRHFTTARGGLTFENVYEVTRHQENGDLLGEDAFPRPELGIDWIELEGPIHAVWPPKSHRMVLHESEKETTDEATYAREVLTRFMPKAYRRPVFPAEIQDKLALYTAARPGKSSFLEAIKIPLISILTSPNFLFLVEPKVATATAEPLTPHELASRLAYFLWSSMPDETLFRLASDGSLAQPQVMQEQVDRLLADPRSEAFVKNFSGQWLGLRKVGANPPVKGIYPDYDRHFEISIVRESEGFFSEILRHDLDVRNFLKTNFVTINERLARFYGIPSIKGDEIRRVPIPDGLQRGGIVTQAAIHTITSNGTRTSPVSRGVWVLKTLLGTDPGLPLANVGEIANEIPGIDKATVRQRLALHRENPSCARCHDKIDPLGFALENFNAVGQWRDRESRPNTDKEAADDPVIDATGKMPNGVEFVGLAGLQDALLGQHHSFENSLATQLTTYAIGRELGFSDREEVRRLTSAMNKNGNSLRSLIHAISTSPLFTTH